MVKFRRLFSAAAALTLLAFGAASVQAADLLGAAEPERKGILPEINIFDDDDDRVTVIGSERRLRGGPKLEIRPVSVNGAPLLGIFEEDNAPAGRRHYGVEVTIDEGTLGAVYTGETVLVADLEAGGEYKVVGAPAGENLQVWIIDTDSGAPVSRRKTVIACRSPTILSDCR